jgi:hypothetical protein
MAKNLFAGMLLLVDFSPSKSVENRRLAPIFQSSRFISKRIDSYAHSAGMLIPDLECTASGSVWNDEV